MEEQKNSKEAHPATHVMYIQDRSSQMPILIPELLAWLPHPESGSWDSSAMPYCNLHCIEFAVSVIVCYNNGSCSDSKAEASLRSLVMVDANFAFPMPWYEVACEQCQVKQQLLTTIIVNQSINQHQKNAKSPVLGVVLYIQNIRKQICSKLNVQEYTFNTCRVYIVIII